LKDPLFALRIDLFSFDDSMNNYRHSSAFIPRATPLLVNSLVNLEADAARRSIPHFVKRAGPQKLTRCEISDSQVPDQLGTEKPSSYLYLHRSKTRFPRARIMSFAIQKAD
jgi:hypothetical protein